MNTSYLIKSGLLLIALTVSAPFSLSAAILETDSYNDQNAAWVLSCGGDKKKDRSEDSDAPEAS